MVGAYTYTLISLNLGVPPWLALPTAALAGAVIGWLTERWLMRPLYTGYGSWGLMKDEYAVVVTFRSEEHTSELQSLMRISSAVFCLKTKNKQTTNLTIE